MRLLFADKELFVGGRSMRGFPLLLGNDMDAVEPAQTFLWHLLLSGKRSNPKTWISYGRAIYDYFGFLSGAGLRWDTPSLVGYPSPIQSYRDWSIAELKLQPRTVNSRLRIIEKFYVWAQQKKHINTLPFEYVTVRTNRSPGFLAHVDKSLGKVQTADFMLANKRREVRFLTKGQVAVCRDNIFNQTHRLMFDLMVRTGLRSEECRTFPEKYIFDPTKRKDLNPEKAIRITLKSGDMKTKFGNERGIDVPYSLMENLWRYSVRYRQKREFQQREAISHTALFLTESGDVYTQNALTQIFQSLKERIGFEVHPHMLRHTYATHLLWTLRKSRTFEGDPLLYVRDRLGHVSVSSTEVYLHLLNSLEGDLVLAHEDELDVLFRL